MSIDGRKRWLALYVLCLGDLMIVLDSTIVNVALPSIRDDLGFSETSLAWVVNAYLLTYGGFLLLGGRLGDLFGHRRLFVSGIALFTAASLACGLAGSQAFLVGARAVQGLGGAVVAAVALSLIMTMFTEPADRAKAMGVIGFVAAGGGSLGVLLGGILTDTLNWHWIFLVNVPTANVVGVLWAAAMFAWFFLSALYLQLVLGYSPLHVGLAFLPANLIMGAFSLGLSAKLVMRFGIRPPLATGLLLAALGLALFARAPVDGHFVADVLPSMILLGFGAGLAFNPVLLAAMSDVQPSESGLASGLVNTSFMMGGALGLAALASLAASRTDTLLASGDAHLAALAGGYHAAFIVGAIFAVAAAGLGATLLRAGMPTAAHAGNEELGVPAMAEAE